MPNAKLPLSVTHPELAKQSVGWDPSTVSRGSVKKLKWRCNKNHEWVTTPNSRTNQGAGCPYCSNKYLLVGFNDLATTHPKIAQEAFEWDPKSLGKGSLLKKLWLCEGHIYTATVADRVSGTSCPYCSGRKVLVGFNDLATSHPDIASEAYGWDPTLYSKGSSIVKSWLCNKGHTYKMDVASRAGRGRGCSVCSGRTVLVGANDLQSIHPEIANEAYGWDPRTVTFGSAKMMSWRCPQGHIWKSVITNRVGNENGCPVCSGRQVLKGFNDLLTTNPTLAEQAYNWDPSTVSYGSEKRKAWRCEEGHIWVTSVKTRSRGSRCPSCTKTGFDPNIDSWLYFLSHSRWEMFQIGITNYPDERLQDHKTLGWKTLELRGPMDGHLTQQWETAILRMLRAKGADLSNGKIAGKFDGYSEAWSQSTFQVKSIKELMYLTEEFEESGLQIRSSPKRNRVE